ncbi:TPA: hypothetical protein ACXJQA_005973 [Pseudomonas aeruginosa]|uniref:hypothetical protein n=1 Tax=Pseudomonas aeruginosa TaxID=287 RepID=UPI0003B9B625|nr:hypothetical protein [Pseudomonas aeruginosa]EKW8671019.1 hypothetical protein [Pseudomonas aeruginosa]ERY58720.1 hypothetical protein Q056_03499 [Pseudomonas aeruginosa BL02]KSN43784.1 hypothetical protein APA87_19675 [Pseudomonas aeruginosa]MBG4007865.1 hypothetical protein [Pseudomonas aeruginosa]MBH9430474.1 hypothetical protein [Pseudomonas aeruginosa]
MERTRISGIGMMWFKNATQYAQFLAIFEDAHVMPTTYSQWFKRANGAYEQFLRQGAFVVKAQASPEEFKAWCAKHGHRLNADGRMAFGSFKAMEKFSQANPGHEQLGS